MNASIRQPRNIGRCLSLHAAARQQDVRLIFNKRNIRQLTVFVSPAWRHSSAHSWDSSTGSTTLSSRPGIRSFTWQGLETSSWSSSCLLGRQTPQKHLICPGQHLETGHSSLYGAMVERRDGPSWRCDDDNAWRPWFSVVFVVQRLGVGLVIERTLVRLPTGALSSQLG